MIAGFAPGTVLAGRYRIVRPIAEGGVGAVYEAEHLVIGKRVAVKVLLGEFQDQSRAVDRFIQEARSACMIEHDNVVNLIDIDQTDEGTVFLVMEYLVGRDLAAAIRQGGRLAWPYARDVALQMCAALAAAHDRGIVHRDLKPSNCFIVDGLDAEVVKVLDFGLAKVLESGGPQVEPRGPSRETVHDLRWLRTDAGPVFGTLACMAPEQLAGDPHDHRVDIYAVGMILYEMLTGTLPFAFDAPEAFVRDVLFTSPEPPSRRAPAIPPELDRVVLRALAKRPDDRFADMNALRDALLAVQEAPIDAPIDAPVAPQPVPEDSPWRRRGPRLAAAAGFVLLLLGLRATLGPEPAQEAVLAADASALVVAAPPPAAPLADPPTPPEPTPPEPTPPEPTPPEPATAPRPTNGGAKSKPPRTPTPTPTAPSPTPPAGASGLPTLKLSPAERRELLAPHAVAIEAKCKRPNKLEHALLALQITMEGTRIVKTTLVGDQGAAREAAAKCIGKYLAAQIKLPRPLVGSSTFSYTF
jgi:serine/threonine-protein kinase